MDNKQGLIIYNTPDGKSKVALMARDGMVWLNQQSIAELFGTSIPNISIHISNIFRDKELDKDSVVKDYLTTAADGRKDILTGKGSISNDVAEAKAREEYESFDVRRKQFDAIQADQDDIKELEEWSKSNK